jgi:hypothetical protein
VNGDSATLPIGRSFDPLFVERAFPDEILSQGFSCGGLRGDPGVALPGRGRPARQRVLQQRSCPGGGGAAVQPSDLDRRTAGKLLLFFFTCNFGDDQSAGRRGQLFQAPADGRQRSLVANKQIPIEIVGNDK